MLPLIHPMEPVLVDPMPISDQYLYQVKWDGVRILAYIEQGEVRLFTRRHRPRTHIYPEIQEALAEQFPDETLVLDGEVVSIHNGRADFFQLMKRDRLRDSSKIETRRRQIPVTYIIFDLLYEKGDWLGNQPLSFRLKRLQNILSPNEQLQFCFTTDDGEALFEYTLAQNWEGVVAKQKDGFYHVGEKNSTWLKRKHFRTIQAQVIGVKMKSGQVSSLLLGIKNQGDWHYIGRVSSGLTHSDRNIFNQKLNEFQRPRSILYNPPAFPGQEIIWLEPKLTVQVIFLEWTPDGTLRSPKLKGFSLHEKDTGW